MNRTHALQSSALVTATIIISPPPSIKFGHIWDAILSLSPHIATVYSKAMKVLGLLYRRFYGYADSESLKQLYLTLVRPHLDYACQVWDPNLIRNKAKLEKVQKFACGS